MASALSPLEEDLTCPVCCEIFSEPVLLSCSHSFCRECLQKSWKGREDRECPVCRRRTDGTDPPLNLALKNACEFVVKQRSAGAPTAPTAEQDQCPVHSGKLQLFCVDDQQLVCVECVAGEHQRHNFCSISKVAEERREELQIKQKALQLKLNSVKRAKNTYSQHFQSQVQQTEDQIREEFEELHQFLREEEKERITALREEEEKKRKKLKKKTAEMESMIESLTEKIEVLKDGLGSEDVAFMTKYTEAKKSAEYTVPEPQLDSGALIDVAKHVGNLRYRVWEKMKDLCPYFPVILDPNSANKSLTLSEDLSRLVPGAPLKALPNNPERFTDQTAVFGSEGFTSGVHSWVVELGENKCWKIGVAKKSAKQKLFSAKPKKEIWAISLQQGQYSWPKDCNPWSIFIFQKIHVQLDCDEQEVTFFNNFHMKIAVMSVKATEKVYPFFCTSSEDALKIQPSKVIVEKK
ncbi:E3 ubiquitin-protein ligase TRIM35-like [Astyanax mexicanus]|uniref:E3 ubiquitin-protein ligase TRIM35-like n=1 Tax=Astyanax mexicanus TaxID=7994 RepID=UPI0020CB558C|nr:E3 ubiquitin-protein ligase TRIM35-like [Astyanax mexicanus]